MNNGAWKILGDSKLIEPLALVSGDARVRVVDTRPVASVTRGFAHETTEVASLFAVAFSHFDPPWSAPSAPFEAARQHLGAVKLIGLKGTPRTLAGDVVYEHTREGDDNALMGPSGGAVLLQGPEGEFVAVRDAAGFHLITIDRRGELTLPLGDWLADRSCAEWLREAIEVDAASPRVVDRLDAAGTLGRLWTAASEADRRAMLRGGWSSPVDRARAWAATAGDPTSEAFWEQIEDDRRLFVDTLSDLEGCDDRARSAAMTRYLCLQRDRFESMRVALRWMGLPTTLDHLLTSIDEEARSRMPWFVVDDALRDEPRLDAVLVNEPQAWWAAPLLDDPL